MSTHDTLTNGQTTHLAKIKELLEIIPRELHADKIISKIKDQHRAEYTHVLTHHLRLTSASVSERNFTLAITQLAETISASLLFIYLDEKSYLKPLKIQLKKLRYKNDYGDLIIDLAKKQIQEFVRTKTSELSIALDWTIKYKFNHIYKKIADLKIINRSSGYGAAMMLSPAAHLNNKEYINVMTDKIYNLLLIAESLPTQSSASENQYSEKISATEYENLIANKLSIEFGWNTKTTKGSGDQGADVIAEKQGITLIIQCKHYNHPVGNKAVQEAHAAKGFYLGDHAAVVTNSTFTKSALQLAESLEVFTIHHEQLNDLDKKIFTGT